MKIVLTKKEKKIRDRAIKVLENNWTELENGLKFTKPSRDLYPFQWNWDSGFIAYGYAHIDPIRAIEEMRSLFSGQWSNGFLPHIVFHAESTNYFPGPDFWQVDKVCDFAPKNVRPSGLTQPPIHGLALWHIYNELADKNSKEKLLKEFFPKVYSLHQYLMTKRDPEGTGLVTIFHPWESGFDNSPRWDQTIGNIIIESNIAGSYTRFDLMEAMDPLSRPTDRDYDIYVNLALNLKKNNYDDDKIYKDHPFKIKDKVFSTLLYLSNIRLRKMALAINEDTSQIDKWIANFERSYFDLLWSDEDALFFDFDINADKRIKIKTVAAVIPFYAGLLSKSKLKNVVSHLDKSAFCGEGVCKYHLAPSAGIEEVYFHPKAYWRGPIWINVNWMIWKGLKENGYNIRASHIKKNILDLLDANGFYEYFDPITGKGYGSKGFSWTAALVVDLLADH